MSKDSAANSSRLHDESTSLWGRARDELSRPDGSINIAYAAVDKNIAAGRGTAVAIRYLSKSGEVHETTYADLLVETSRFASALAAHEVRPGSRVYTLLGRVPELYVSALGTLRHGAVFTPLFSAFGPEPIKTRMEIGEANLLVTTASLYRKKIAKWRDELTSLAWILIVDGEPADVPTSLPLMGGAVELPEEHRGLGEPAFHERLTSGHGGLQAVRLNQLSAYVPVVLDCQGQAWLCNAQDVAV
jgi:acetyl-CoA synthetase